MKKRESKGSNRNLERKRRERANERIGGNTTEIKGNTRRVERLDRHEVYTALWAG